MKESLGFIIDIITMQVAYVITRILRFVKYMTLLLFIIFSLFDVPVSRLAVMSFGWMMLTFVLTLLYNKSFDKFRIIAFLLIVSAIGSTICFIIYSCQAVYHSQYSYLFVICIGSWFAEEIMAHVGYNHVLSCKNEYIKKGLIKEKDTSDDNKE